MTNKDLADLIFPNLEHDVEYYEKLYPERNLPEGAYVTRFAPSPTGYMHIGNFMSTTIDYVLAKNTNGVFYLRNEDTDKAREISGESTIDIYKYQKMYREGTIDEPISHLFIISDEFAELKNQQPEFMEQLISTARIGRSLGVHLILAT